MNPDVTATLPTLLSIFEARRRIARHVRRTPLVPSPWLSRESGADVWLKLESLQRTHSFKIRGALNAALRLAEEHQAGELVTASAGNHGRALAEAARDTGMPCVVFTPADAARTKLEAIRAAGARLEAHARNYDEAEQQAIAYAERSGARFVSPYNHPDVIAGGGTTALEVLDELPTVEAILVPVGGGGLISGIGLAVDGINPRTRVIGVEAELNPAFRIARAHGRITPFTPSESIADGLGGNIQPGSITFDLVERHVDDLLAVSEAQIAAAMAGLVWNEHLVAEGAAAVGIAVLLHGLAPHLAGHRVVVVVSGANVDRGRLAQVLATA